MNSMLRLLSSMVGLLGFAYGQDQASTLLRCAERADLVVRATVVAATDPSPDWHRLEFRTTEVLKGQLGNGFAVLEPAGACCGRSLFTLQAGDRCLLFLQRQGPTLHPLAGSRGVVADEPATAAHVRELLAATADGQRAELLATALTSPVARVADDAAQALAVLPGLQLGPRGRAAVHQALATALAHGRTTAAPLAEAAVRAAADVEYDQLLPLYLDQTNAAQAALLRRALARGDGDTLLGRLPGHLPPDGRRHLRAAELLVAMPTPAAPPVLRSMLTGTQDPKVQLQVAEGLLADGVPATALQHAVPAVVLDLAIRRSQAAPSFRSLRPNRP